MNQPATILPMPSSHQGIEPAIVTGPCDPDGYVSVCRQGDTAERRARMAIQPRPALSPDDEVLTMTDGSGTMYVVGVLSLPNRPEKPGEEVRLADGSSIRIDRSANNESLKLYSRNNELLIDYRSETGTMTVHAASGNLEFSAPEGGIAFRCAKDIAMEGNQVALNARSDLHVGIQEASGKAGPALSMRSRKTQLASPVFDLTVQRAQVFAQETEITGRKLLGRIADVQFVVRRIESVAETVMAKAKNVYRTVVELSQLRAGRQRTLIDTTSHTKARKTIVKSETDFKVKAEKIHLG
jgi:hypothetical protein